MWSRSSAPLVKCIFLHGNYWGESGLLVGALPKASSGAPIWPTGNVGSLSHDSRIAVSTIGLRRDFSALGIDIKTADPLPSRLLNLVATPQ